MDERESSIECVAEQRGYPVPISQARWSLTLALLTLAVVIATLTMLLSVNPVDGPI